MDDWLYLRQKLTFEAHGRKAVFVKKPVEHMRHVLMKALLWALYLPRFPELRIEVAIGTRYKPDLVAIDAGAQPLFWAEAGRVSDRKMRALVKRYRHTHFAFAKWNERLAPVEKKLADAIAGTRRSAPVELISFPSDADKRFFGEDGCIDLSFRDLTTVRFPAA